MEIKMTAQISLLLYATYREVDNLIGRQRYNQLIRWHYIMGLRETINYYENYTDDEF